ncbi:hypothetical protein PSTG_06062 [Puccinia striiformis f. sp. tritici PST-78]|uniref:Uncharacterized protein n=1 Tax=Puccinia striiformis f. sp. tritici PST-78 TaxID=1165861 RepID=A0A0L0VNQ8_9BASI|nr:hypothetical protein PSTG_06062 [Puccinia striiformis f. sp. tritici PST-78]
MSGTDLSGEFVYSFDDLSALDIEEVLAGLYQPSMADLYQPSMANLYQPSMADLYQPSMADLYQPSMADLYQPSMADLYQPSSKYSINGCNGAHPQRPVRWQTGCQD